MMRKPEKLILENPETKKEIKISISGHVSEIPGFFLFSSIKAGSTLLNKMIRQYCDAISQAVVDIPGQVFASGELLHKVNFKNTSNIFFKDGYGFIGWRSFWHQIPAERLENCRNILLVRDPRDRLVSLYFSLAYSHQIPNKGEARIHQLQKREEALQLNDINDWVLSSSRNVEVVRNGQMQYMTRLPASTTRIYRYEDVIFKKLEWMEDMIKYLDLPRDRTIMEEVVSKHDVRVAGERQGQHIRQVTPGNYLKHLREDVIDFLNVEYREILQSFGYLSGSSGPVDIFFARESQPDHPFSRLKI